MDAIMPERIVAESSDKEAWLTARMTGVTASDASKLMVGANLDGLVYKKLNNTFKGNKWTDWGLEREPIILEMVDFPQNTALYRSADNPHFMATPDGIKYIDGELWLCQVKTTSKGWVEMPEDYRRQCLWEQYVMGATKTLFVWEEHKDFIPTDLEPKTMVLERDEETIKELIGLAQDFLQILQTQTEPTKEGNK